MRFAMQRVSQSERTRDRSLGILWPREIHKLGGFPDDREEQFFTSIRQMF
jgi:hypothetical protein